MDILTAIFVSMSSQYNLPPGLLYSLCYVESKHNVHAVHHDDGATDSLGACQIKLNTARWLGFKGTQQELMEPFTNVRYAAKYLAYQIHRYRDIRKAVIAYNLGHAGILTTTKYQSKVFKEWRRYAARYQN
jgi:soluble lytic murein transglycosylase-like protein